MASPRNPTAHPPIEPARARIERGGGEHPTATSTGQPPPPRRRAPSRGQARAGNLTARSRAEYARAQTEQERYWAAHRYLSAAAAALRRQDPATADAILHDVVRTLLHAGDTLTAHLATPRPRGSTQRRPRGEPR